MPRKLYSRLTYVGNHMACLIQGSSPDSQFCNPPLQYQHRTLSLSPEETCGRSFLKNLNESQQKTVDKSRTQEKESCFCHLFRSYIHLQHWPSAMERRQSCNLLLHVRIHLVVARKQGLELNLKCLNLMAIERTLIYT